MSMNLYLKINGTDINLRQTPTVVSYKIFVQGNAHETVTNYLHWVMSLYSVKDMQEIEKELAADYHRAVATMWEFWEEGDEEPSLDKDEYMVDHSPFSDAQRIVELVEQAMVNGDTVEFNVW